MKFQRSDLSKEVTKLQNGAETKKKKLIHGNVYKRTLTCVTGTSGLLLLKNAISGISQRPNHLLDPKPVTISVTLEHLLTKLRQLSFCNDLSKLENILKI